MRAVETSMKIHQDRVENVGFLSLCAETGSRMGATLVISCLKGTDATAMALSLEQVVLLTRSHGLPPKSFQTALSVMRSQVSLSIDMPVYDGMRNFDFCVESYCLIN